MPSQRKLPEGLTRLPSGSIRWRVAVDGRRYTGTAESIAEAKRGRAAAVLAAGGEPEETATVRELVDLWLDQVDHAAATAQTRDFALSKVPPAFMARDAGKVTAPIVAGLWRELEEAGVGRHVIVKARNALSKSFEFGLQLGIVSANPIRLVKPRSSTWPATDGDRVEPPTDTEVRDLLDELDGPLLASAAAMATCGARPGEICGLQWDDLNIAAGTIYLSRGVDRFGTVTAGKNGPKGYRTIQLGAAEITALRSIDRLVGVPWIFCHPDGSPWRPDWVRKQLAAPAKAAGIADFNPYRLRHFAVTQALAAGVDVTEVAEMIGDNPATVWRVYAHWIRATPTAAIAVAATLNR